MILILRVRQVSQVVVTNKREKVKERIIETEESTQVVLKSTTEDIETVEEEDDWIYLDN